MNSATPVQLYTFEQKYMDDQSFQLLTYRHLKVLCDTQAREQAIYLDLAMHPPLILAQRLATSRLDYPFLNRARRAGGTVSAIRPPASQFHPVPGREAVVRRISLDLIESVVSPTATPAQKELFLLKWELDCFSYYVDEQILRYRQQGQADKANRLSDAEYLAVMQVKLTRMKKGAWRPDHSRETPGVAVARGLRQVELLLSIVNDTATTAIRQTFTRHITASDQLYADVLEIQKLYEGMFSPQERQKGAKLKRILEICDLSLIEQIASTKATEAENRSFVARLDESGEFHQAIEKKYNVYRALRSMPGYKKAAELRVAVERANIVQRTKDLLLGNLERDPNLDRPMQIARLNAA